MKLIFILFMVLPSLLFANTQYLIIDQAKIKEKQDYKKSTHVTGRVIDPGTEKDVQLKFYVRGCGKINVPRNSKGDTPKSGQNINVTIKDRCKISDWQ
jgi:hypothetical protein